MSSSSRSLSRLTTPCYGVLLLALLAIWLPAHAASTIYVNSTATGANTGASWTNAFTTLQAALQAATKGDEIWVARGIYRPTGPNGDGTISFTIKDGVAIYGGFAGNETARIQRNSDPATNGTVLSGDLNGDDGSGGWDDENSYHVVTSSGVSTKTVLDGFTISDGNANGTGDSCPGTRCGGGMVNEDNSNPALVNLILRSNFADFGGGGMANFTNSSPTLTNVTFSGNRAGNPYQETGHGGGMYNTNSSPTLTNVTFRGNGTYSDGGGMYNSSNSSPKLTQVTFMGNATDAGNGGGMANVTNSSPMIAHTTFMSNTADNNKGGGGLYDDNSSPTLTDVTFTSNTTRYANGAGMANLNASNATLTNVTFTGGVIF